MKYIVQSGIDVGKNRYEVGDSITKEQMGKSFKWLVMQGIVLVKINSTCILCKWTN